MEARRQWEDRFKTLKEKTVNQEFYVQQNQLSKMKEKLGHSQVNRNGDRSSPADLIYEK